MSTLTAASLIGPGKLEELSALVKLSSEVDSVVFDHELTTTQVRNIREGTIAPDGTVRFHHVANGPADRPAVSALLAIVQEVQ